VLAAVAMPGAPIHLAAAESVEAATALRAGEEAREDISHGGVLPVALDDAAACVAYVRRAPTLRDGARSVPKLITHNPPFGGVLANPIGFGPLETATPTRLVVLDPLGPVPHVLAPIDRILKHHLKG
jgi:hypothetical protein